MENDADFYTNALLVPLQQTKEKPVQRPSKEIKDKDLRRPQGRARHQSLAVHLKTLKVLKSQEMKAVNLHLAVLDAVEEEEKQVWPLWLS